MHKVLLTSVCRPLGEAYGDGPSVGYELLYGQVTRAQGMFSPRANHVTFSLNYVAENLDAPATVLQYPSRGELVRELKRGYDVVGVSFVLATFHRMKEVVALVRRHAPGATIVLGGYGTVLSDEVLKPYGDAICREEGVAFMRRLLGEPELAMPYRHPTIISRLSVFGREISRTGMIFAGLGCPNACDFCCTSHFFKRKHIRLLPTGRDIYNVVERYHRIERDMAMVVLDEDFLLNRRRAMEFRDCVQQGGKPISIFCFASVRALSRYTTQDLLEMGIDGLWIGYEGTRSGYAKQEGKPVTELFPELHAHGISILASMIVGFPYQTPEIIQEEFDGLMALRPDYAQFLIYGPTPGTPFYENVTKAGLLHQDLVDDRERYYRNCTGFTAMVRHPSMTPAQIEAAQRRCFDDDFRRQGPSIFRSMETWLEGHLTLKASPNPILRAKAEYFARQIRNGYPAFRAGRLLGPGAEARKRIADLEKRIHGVLGAPTMVERIESVAALGLAAWTGLTLKAGLFQHPKLVRHRYRVRPAPARVWRKVGRKQIRVETLPELTVRVRVEGSLGLKRGEKLVAGLQRALRKSKERLLLDLERLGEMERGVAERIAEGLEAYRERIRLVLPRTEEGSMLALRFASSAG